MQTEERLNQPGLGWMVFANNLLFFLLSGWGLPHEKSNCKVFLTVQTITKTTQTRDCASSVTV